MTVGVSNVRVDLAERSYEIAIGPGVIQQAGAALRAAGARRAVVIADSGVLSNHAITLEGALRHAGVDSFTIPVPSGESSKSAAEAGRLWEILAAAAIDRQTHLVAVGGGVVGDLAGFVAATFARGLAVWQVPTTLVAQVDSAIGGKTGINLQGGKNLVGAFWQPRGVLADIETLVTLPEREFTSGLAEVVKYGMILDAELFGWLEEHADAVHLRRPEDLAHIVRRSVELKASVVERDEHERTGLRAILNYGHTFAHAYETACGYGRLLHGEAVAIGMADAADLAVRLGRIPAELAVRQERLLEALRLPIRLPAGPLPTADELMAVMARDKKSLHGSLRFVLPDALGSVALVPDVDGSLVRHVLARQG